jgi:hypothetical protein
MEKGQELSTLWRERLEAQQASGLSVDVEEAFAAAIA